MIEFPLFLQACGEHAQITSSAPHYDLLTGRRTAIATIDGELCLIDLRLNEVEA